MVDFKELNATYEIYHNGYTNIPKNRLIYFLKQKDRDYLALKKQFDTYVKNSEYEVEQLRIQLLFHKRT